MSYTECSCLERKLAFHTAPSLLKIKPANLFSISKNDFDEKYIKEFNKKAITKGLTLQCLCECKNKKLLLLYNKQILESNLRKPDYIRVLKNYGYTEKMSLDDMLNRLSDRIRQSESFPHEIGLFLGYPIEDVCGFIENRGENFKLCGYWKVYGDEKKAERTFNNYNKCRDFVCNKLSEGYNLFEVLKINN